MSTRHEPRSARATVRATRPVGAKVGRERHRGLLSNPRVKSWYDERALSSRLSADVYLRQLGGMAERLRLDPDEMARVAAKDPERLHDLLVRYAADLKASGRLDSYVLKTFDGLRSWLRSRRVKFDEFPRLGKGRNESIQTEVTPAPEQLRTILYGGMSLRGRSSALFMAHSGVRPGVLGSYQARDGLTLGDLPELKLGAEPKFAELPFVVRVPARLSKTRQTYTTFGSRELADTYLAYLKERTERGERLGPKSPVIAADPLGMTRGFAKDTGFLTTKGVVKELHDEIAKHVAAGVKFRPYVFRAYCSTRLLLAEMNGKIPAALREAILGHDGGVASRYHVGKPWGAELLKEAREAYRRAEPYLLTYGLPSESASDRVLRALFRARGATDKEIGELAAKTDEEIAAWIKERGLAVETEKRNEKAVPVDAVPTLLEAGWEFVAPLNGAMAVLRPPTKSRGPSGSSEVGLPSDRAVGPLSPAE